MSELDLTKSSPKTQDNGFGDYDDKITRLEGQVNDLSSLNDQIASLKSAMPDINAIMARLSVLEERITSATSQQQEQQQQKQLQPDHSEAIIKLESICLKQKEELNSMRQTVAELSSKIQHLETTAKSNAAAAPANKTFTARPAPTSMQKPKAGSVSSQPAAQKSSPTASLAGPKRITRPSAPSNSKASNSSMKASPTHSKEDGVVRTYLRGRPIAHHLPTAVKDSYDLTTKLEAPEEKLQLEWVYGYRGKDCRDNVLMLQTGEICYFIASVVVLYNAETHSQRHYLGHNDDIRAISLHPDKVTMATGQVAGHDKTEGKAHVRIWNSISLETLQVLGLGEFDRAIATLAFSKVDDGVRLAVIDESNEHILSIWDWHKNKKLAETKSSVDPVVAVDWSPVEPTALATCGKNHLSFWTFENGTLGKKQGVYEKYEKPKVTICMAYADTGDLITGDSSGNIYVWQSGAQRISQACVGAHDGAVFSIAVNAKGSVISGGGKDRKVYRWNAQFERDGNGLEIPEWFGACRVVTVCPDSEALYVGTTKNCLLTAESMMAELSVIVQGQFDEFWALAAHPCTHHFISAGQDCQVILWDALARQAIWSTKVQFPIYCAAFYPLISESSVDPVVALGASAGKWLVMSIARHEVIAVHTDGIEQIQCISYSPDGKYLAVGSRDNFTYIYQVSEEGQRYSRVGKCSAHSSFVLHLDWSQDSTCLRTMSGDYEVLYWSPDGKQMTTAKNPDLWDTEWASHSVTLGWDSIGIWGEGCDGTDVNCCAWNKSVDDRRVLVTGDDSGKVNLYTYPSCQMFAKPNSYGGHSSHVTEICFTFDDSRVISAGGKDAAVLQWSLTPA